MRSTIGRAATVIRLASAPNSTRRITNRGCRESPLDPGICKPRAREPAHRKDRGQAFLIYLRGMNAIALFAFIGITS